LICAVRLLILTPADQMPAPLFFPYWGGGPHTLCVHKSGYQFTQFPSPLFLFFSKKVFFLLLRQQSSHSCLPLPFPYHSTTPFFSPLECRRQDLEGTFFLFVLLCREVTLVVFFFSFFFPRMIRMEDFFSPLTRTKYTGYCFVPPPRRRTLVLSSLSFPRFGRPLLNHHILSTSFLLFSFFRRRPDGALARSGFLGSRWKLRWLDLPFFPALPVYLGPFLS